MKKIIICFLSLVTVGCTSYRTIEYNPSSDDMLEEKTIPHSGKISEVWAYLMAGEEKDFQSGAPITDLCYFSAEINFRGELRGPSKIPGTLALPSATRTHLVVANISNSALLHFCMDPAFPVRAKLLDDISTMAESYNGIQIDFESVHKDDRIFFMSFLQDLKLKNPGKIISVAIPARTKFISEDPYDYAILSRIADRIIIMAYDEHWSGSEAGPVASITWCSGVASYAVSVIPGDKLVMGIPLYGRSWQNKSYAKSVRYKNAVEMKKNYGRTARTKDKESPSFEYEEAVKVTVYYENISSIMKKVKLYRDNGVQSVAFWRIGQEPKDLWGYFTDEK